MLSFTYIIQDELGIHARPAGALLKAAKSFKSTVTVESGEKQANVTSLMAVMRMGIKKGQEVTVKIEGEDEAECLAAMKHFFQENL